MNYHLIQTILASLHFFLIIFGTIGNLCTFCILMRSNIRKHSCMRYLATLCLLDICCLYTWNFSTVYKELFTGKKIEFEGAIICRIFSFHSYFTLQVSSWIIIWIGIERIVIITTKKTNMFTNLAKNNVLVLFLIIGIFAVINSVVLVKNATPFNGKFDSNQSSLYSGSNQTISYELRPRSFKERRKYTCYDPEEFYYIWDVVHSFLYSIIPFFIILIENLVIGFLTFQQARKMNLKNNPTTSLESRQAIINVTSKDKILILCQKRSKKMQNKSSQVQNLLLFLTISFFVSTLPYSMFYALRLNSFISNKEIKDIWTAVLSLLQYVRHSSNFLIYLLTSSIIYSELQIIIKELGLRKQSSSFIRT